MAKNYTVSEATQIIAAGTDKEALADLGKRYPLFTIELTKLVVKAGADLVNFMGYMPEYLTANKVNKVIKEGIEGTEEVEDDVEDEEVEEEKPAKKATKKSDKKAADVDTSDTDWANMPNAKLYKLLGDYGERKKCKEEFGDFSKAHMVAFFNKYHSEGPVEEEDEVEDEVEEVKDYESMSAQELFKLCKTRKIKAAPKKPAKFYIDLLKKADAEEAEDDEADDWSDEEEEVEEEEKPKKAAPAKKAAKKAAPAKKAAKKPVEVEEEEDADDDDDWDI